MGKRGKHHATPFHANPRFEVVGICDIQERLRVEAGRNCWAIPRTGTDAAGHGHGAEAGRVLLLHPAPMRSEMIQIGLDCGARLIAFEKPVALTSAEGIRVKRLLDRRRRQGGGQPPAPLRRALPQGEGDHRQRRARPRAHRVRHAPGLDDAHAVPPHRLHALVQRRRRAAVGHGPGRGQGQVRRSESTPRPITSPASSSSPTACAASSNAARARPTSPRWSNGGARAASARRAPKGFAEVLTSGGWRAVTKERRPARATGAMNYDLDMPPYIQDMADWLDDDAPGAPLQLRQRLQGLRDHDGPVPLRRAGGQVALPLDRGARTRSKAAAEGDARPQSAPVVTGNAKEYGAKDIDARWLAHGSHHPAQPERRRAPGGPAHRPTSCAPGPSAGARPGHGPDHGSRLRGTGPACTARRASTSPCAARSTWTSTSGCAPENPHSYRALHEPRTCSTGSTSTRATRTCRTAWRRTWTRSASATRQLIRRHAAASICSSSESATPGTSGSTSRCRRCGRAPARRR